MQIKLAEDTYSKSLEVLPEHEKGEVELPKMNKAMV